MSTDDIIRIIVFVVAAFVPPLLYLIGIRNTERYGKEPWKHLIKAFLWGAIIAVIIAVILGLLLVLIYQYGLDSIPSITYLGENATFELIILSVVIAPFTEEFAKGIGVYTVRDEITEEEDGLVYGAACGLGFSATENLLYGALAFVIGGWAGFFTLIIVRSIASTLLHASATSIMGYGIGKSLIWEDRSSVFPYYMAAVGMHASFNLLASIGVIYESRYGASDPNAFYVHLLSLMVVIIFALVALGLIRTKIRSLEASKHHRYNRMRVN
jgi:RsiW-degrading membrane proteinase PrsW (M82 family)